MINHTFSLKCGCKVMIVGELADAQIEYCPLHKAAPDLHEALRAIMTERYDTWSPMYKQAKQALAKAEGG